MNRKSKRLNPFSEARSFQGQFKRKCGALIHGLVHDDKQNEQLLHLRKRKKIKKHVYSKLLSKGVIKSNTYFICKACYMDQSTVPPQNDTDCTESDTDKSDSSSEDNEELSSKCIEIAKELSNLISTDVKNLRSKTEINCIQQLNNFEVSDWLLKRPSELLHLLCELCQVDINCSSDKKIIVLGKVIELIYFSRSSKLVLPNHFLENLLCYSFTNCKSYLNFEGSRSPGGAYTFITTWLKKQAQNPIEFPPGLVKVVFDNFQKVGRTYAITGTNIVPTSVITSSVWITLDTVSNMQECKVFEPNEWLWGEIDDDSTEKLFEALTQAGEGFRRTRDIFIDNCIILVYKQHKNNSDPIDDILHAQLIASNEKRCTECGCESDVTYRICRNCGGKVMKEILTLDQSEEIDIHSYDCFSAYIPTLPGISCKTGQPDFINPNGYQQFKLQFYHDLCYVNHFHVIQVIQTIRLRSGIRQYGQGKREWVMIECDGLPYNLLRDIIENVWRCSHCNECFYNIDVFQEHKCAILAKGIPVCGLLHLEINAGRAFTKLNWEIFASKLGFILGLKSPKVQEYLKKGSEHHKLWHFLEILYISISLELMVPYVKGCISLGTTPNSNDYWNWCKDIDDPNYLYMQHAVFTHLHGLMMLRAGKFIYKFKYMYNFSRYKES